MKPIRSKPLIVAVVAIAIVIAVLSRLGWGSLQIRQIEGFAAFGLNVVTAIFGFWTPHRAAWAAYLVVSILAFVPISAATPLNGLLILAAVAFDSLSNR